MEEKNGLGGIILLHFLCKSIFYIIYIKVTIFLVPRLGNEFIMSRDRFLTGSVSGTCGIHDQPMHYTKRSKNVSWKTTFMHFHETSANEID